MKVKLKHTLEKYDFLHGAKVIIWLKRSKEDMENSYKLIKFDSSGAL